MRALREIGLGADVPADEPTTEGVIAPLERHDLTGRRVRVQLYPDNANERLLKFLEGAGAIADTVLSYVYASEADDARMMAVIAEMATGQIDRLGTGLHGCVDSTLGSTGLPSRELESEHRALC